MQAAPSRPDVLGACLPGARTPTAGKPDMGLGPFTPWGEALQLWLSSCSLVTYLGLDDTMSPPLLPFLLWFLLHIFSCRRSFLLVFRSFLLIGGLQTGLILVCPWEEVCSGSSYSTFRTSQPWASLIAQLVKNLPAVQETLVRFLGQEDPLEKG